VISLIVNQYYEEKPSMPDSPYLIEALARGLEILNLFSKEHRTLTMTEVVQLTGYNKATVYRVLSTLESLGYLERDLNSKRYRPGLKVLALGFSAINQFDVRQVAHPYLQDIVQELELTASLGILDNLSVVYIDRIRSRAVVGVLLGLGGRIPAHCSSMGKALLAHLHPEELRARLLNVSFEPCTARSISTVEQLWVELDQVQRTGYAINDGELNSGLRAIAAPIFDVHRRVVAAVNVSGSKDIISYSRLHDELPAQIQETARQITKALSLIEV
jgi:DNA-binding IclR family transcriptional regulator